MGSEPLARAREKSFTASHTRLLVNLIALVPVGISIWLWVGSLSEFNLSQMGEVGLVSILPARYILALVFLTLGFALAVHQPAVLSPIRAAYLVVLIAVLHATPQLLYGTLRYSWAWKHVAIIDYIQRHGSVDPTIQYLSVYHNWPGFFALGALITQLGGQASAISFAGWGPPFFNLIDLGALLLIYRVFTNDRRLIWLGVWFFYLGNWIGQDYFSPQALTYFLYLVVLAICLNWFRMPGIPALNLLDRIIPRRYHPRNTSQPAENGSRAVLADQRVGLAIIIILACITMASTHQLSPLMLLTASLGLVVLGVCQIRSLPALILAVTVAWVTYISSGFFNHNTLGFFSSMGNILANFRSNLINLAASSPGQTLVARMDRGLTALILMLGLLGLFRRFRNQKWDIAAVILLGTPLLGLALSAYGGEIVFRVYYFMLPFAAFFAANVFFPSPEHGISGKLPVVLAAVTGILLVGFIFAYYGKEEMYYFSKQEVSAANYIEQHAQKGALVYSAAWDWPLIIHDYEYYKYETITTFSRSYRLQILQSPVATISKEMGNYPSAYFILSKSQNAIVDNTGLMPAGSLRQIQAALTSSPRFKVVYQNTDAIVFTLSSQPAK